MLIKGIEFFEKIGFKKIGEFKKSKIKDEITIEYDNQYKHFSNNKNEFSFNYAFTMTDSDKKEEKIIYVGQSIKGCHNRFSGYVNVKKDNNQQSTNLKIKEAICKILEDKNNKVNIYILYPVEEMRFKGININIHLGLEPELIKIAKEDNTNCLNGKRYPKELPQIEQKNKDIK